MTARRQSIRARLIALLLVPLVSLVALWAWSAYVTVGEGVQLWYTNKHNFVALDIAGALTNLQQERRLSLSLLSNPQPRPDTVANLRTTRDRVNADIVKIRKGVRDTEGTWTANQAAQLKALFDRLEKLPQTRTAVDARTMDRLAAYAYFNDVSDVAFAGFYADAEINNAESAQDARGVIGLARVMEYLAREDSLLTAMQESGRVRHEERDQLVATIGLQRHIREDSVNDLPNDSRVEFAALATTEPFLRLRSLEDELINSTREGLPLPFGADEWRKTYDVVYQQVGNFALKADNALLAQIEQRGIAILAAILLFGVFGLIALIASFIISIRITRSLVRRLTTLRDSARELADERLPHLVGRLRQGDEVDVATEAPALPHPGDELGEVGDAFNAVQRTAIAAAVDEATLRKGVNEVFLNIARRNQTLLHRQLALLDKMERQTSEPDDLEDLFRVDHLATRMRRHAEDLVILAGATPGRSWRTPVPLVDVVRGAVSEVEDYARITVLPLPRASLLGRAVADVIHMLAELLENATAYSPPQTSVTVSGHLVPNGFAIEIEDRGLGLSAEALDEANAKLAAPPDFDPANSSQLGLFVTSQMAARHGVKIHLRTSPYGGVAAIVLIPRSLVVAEDGRQIEVDISRDDAVVDLEVPRLVEAPRALRPALAVGSTEPETKPFTAP